MGARTGTVFSGCGPYGSYEDASVETEPRPLGSGDGSGGHALPELVSRFEASASEVLLDAEQLLVAVVCPRDANDIWIKEGVIRLEPDF